MGSALFWYCPDCGQQAITAGKAKRQAEPGSGSYFARDWLVVFEYEGGGWLERFRDEGKARKVAANPGRLRRKATSTTVIRCDRNGPWQVIYATDREGDVPGDCLATENEAELVGRAVVSRGSLFAVATEQNVDSRARALNYRVVRVDRPPLAQAKESGVTLASNPDALGQLHKLGELRDSGVITADEFESKKAELLRRV